MQSSPFRKSDARRETPFVTALLAALVATEFVSPAAARTEETLLAIVIDSRTVSDGSVVLHEGDGAYAISADDARAWRLVLPDAAAIHADEKTYFDLRRVPAIAVRFDEDAQQLELTVPSALFEKTTLDALATLASAPQSGRGAYLNYDLRTDGGTGQPLVTSTILASAFNLGNGLASADFVGTVGRGITGLRRLATGWERDDPIHHTSLRLGDWQPDAHALVAGRPFFGAVWSTNFATAPGLVIQPRPMVAGESMAPATADVYIDGRLVFQQSVPQGPFAIQNIPVSQGQSAVSVVLKDAAGHEQAFQTTAYGAPDLLKAGLTEFAVGGGLSRASNAGSGGYRGLVTETFVRRGISDRFTAELSGDLSLDGRSLSGGTTYIVPRLGALTFALSAGGGADGGGTRFSYDREGPGASFGFDATSLRGYATAVFAPGLQTIATFTRSARAHVSFATSARGSLALALASENGADGDARFASIDYGTTIGRDQLSLDVQRSTGAFQSLSATLRITIPIDGRRRSWTTVGERAGRSVDTATIQTDGVYDGFSEKPGYALTVGRDDIEGGANVASQAVDLGVGFAAIDARRSFDLDMRGSLATVGGHAYASRSILQAYGVAVVPGFSGVRVYANNHYVGKTNARGEVLVPGLQPYRENEITLEGKDFPITANVESLVATATPYQGSPAVVRFPVRGNGGAIVHFRTNESRFAAAGSEVTARGMRGVSWPVADRGEAYLDGVTPGPLSLTVTGGEMHCHAEIVVPVDVGSIPDLGEVLCRDESEHSSAGGDARASGH